MSVFRSKRDYNDETANGLMYQGLAGNCYVS
jgi:hypothetical protein